MSSRISILGIVWLLVMILLFATPISVETEKVFNILPSRSIVNMLLFWGLVHIWIGSCKKQLKYTNIRKNAFAVVFGAAAFIGVISELVIYFTIPGVSFNYWNLIFDVLGSVLGVISFRLLYASCY